MRNNRILKVSIIVAYYDDYVIMFNKQCFCS